MRRHVIVGILIGLGLTGAILGAWWYKDGQARTEYRLELIRFALLYHEHVHGNGQGPAGLDELLKWAGSNPLVRHCQTVQVQIRSGEVIVVWNAVFVGSAEENHNYFLAYGKNVPEKGGWVLRGDGAAEQVTAADFKQIPPLPQVAGPGRNPKVVGWPEPTWTRHHTDDRKCSAEFPGKPETSLLPLADREVARLTLQRKPTGFYALNATRSRTGTPPTETADEALDQFRENHLAMPVPDGGRFELVREEKLTQDGVPGRRFDFRAGPDQVSLNRVFVLDGRIYRAGVVIDKEKADDEIVKRFLESVRFR